MTILFEGARSLWVGSPATLVQSSHEAAWAEPHIKVEAHLRWIKGRYVEADRPNLNGHVFPLEDLKPGMATIANKPLNLLHYPNRIVGHYTAAEMIEPTPLSAAGGQTTPFVDALSCFYSTRFPNQMALIEKAHADGGLFYSMEAIPESLTCLRDGCGKEFPYDGRTSPTYCAHLNQPGAKKLLNRFDFIGGALIFPPSSPAWPGADITHISALMEQHAAEAASLYDQVAADFPEQDGRWAERMMQQILLLAERERADQHAAVVYASSYTHMDRMRLADQDKALPDGQYPIDNVDDLRSAIILCRSGHGNFEGAKPLIIRRAKELGADAMLPSDWTGAVTASRRPVRPLRAEALVAAGLAVVAADTGRVLMLQRAIDDTDPASGLWEFPGGHIEPGEQAFDAARREWEEETGAVLPAGVLAGSWMSPNGVYQGFVYEIRSETDVPINADARHVLNPDDPDGDLIEVVAWWDPKDLPSMPALRPECRTTDWSLLDTRVDAPTAA